MHLALFTESECVLTRRICLRFLSPDDKYPFLKGKSPLDLCSLGLKGSQFFFSNGGGGDESDKVSFGKINKINKIKRQITRIRIIN